MASIFKEFYYQKLQEASRGQILLAPDLPGQIDLAGGADFKYGQPNSITAYDSVSNQTLTQNRMYWYPIYLDKERDLLGFYANVNTPSGDAGSVIRYGLWNIGTPAVNNWSVGSLIADFGTSDATVDGNYEQDLVTPITLGEGWYLLSYGSDATGLSMQYSRQQILGSTSLYPHTNAAGGSRVTGINAQLRDNNQGALITGGLGVVGEEYSGNTVTDETTATSQIRAVVIPKWEL